MKDGKIKIDLANGYQLVAERSTDPAFPNEIYVGITDGNGVWWQDIAIVRQDYLEGNDGSVYMEDNFEVLVYADKDNEDYTHHFSVGLYHGGI